MASATSFCSVTRTTNLRPRSLSLTLTLAQPACSTVREPAAPSFSRLACSATCSLRMPSHDCISVRPYGLSVIVNSSSPGRSMSMSRHQSCQSLRSRQRSTLTTCSSLAETTSLPPSRSQMVSSPLDMSSHHCASAQILPSSRSSRRPHSPALSVVKPSAAACSFLTSRRSLSIAEKAAIHDDCTSDDSALKTQVRPGVAISKPLPSLVSETA
mmetsp:Transcript_34649/g.95598  ORF Transcript_34649/g.95598 Transcript_34649/m.95598 type:complete len:213 (-) Transcript_34649:1112-1750(-)